jgi:hypothetical protein
MDFTTEQHLLAPQDDTPNYDEINYFSSGKDFSVVLKYTEDFNLDWE